MGQEIYDNNCEVVRKMNKILFSSFLVLFILIFINVVHAIDGSSQLIASCHLSDNFGGGISITGARMVGTRVECEISCNFNARQIGETNVREPLNPRNGKFTVVVSENEEIRLSAIEVRNRCCAQRSDVCFVPPGLCYIAEDPGRCSSGYIGVSADVKCTYTIKWPGQVPEERRMIREEDCNPPRCPDGTFLVDANEKICCPDDTIYVAGQCIKQIKCGSAANVYSYSSSSFSGDFCIDSTPNPPQPTFPGVGGSTSWSCVGQDGSSINCDASRQGELSCNCEFTGGTEARRTQSRVQCNVFDSSNPDNILDTSNYDTTSADFPNFRRVVTVSGREVSCEMRLHGGCDPEGAPPGVCPPNCKSWQHSACDYGRYGIRMLEAVRNLVNLIPGVDIPDPQIWWNEKLADESTAIGTVYSVLDSIPGTPEWFTAQVCDKGLKLSDEEVCGALGLEEGSCSDSWEGYENFIGDDPVISISADYIPTNYRISWRLHNVDSSERYRVFLANFDTYNNLPRNKRVIFPSNGDFTRPSSENIEYTTSFRYTDVCIEFQTTTGSLFSSWDHFIGGTSLSDGVFTCRRIRFYN